MTKKLHKIDEAVESLAEDGMKAVLLVLDGEGDLYIEHHEDFTKKQIGMIFEAAAAVYKGEREAFESIGDD